MAKVCDLRVAICRRCRWPERRAAGAADESELLRAARAFAASEAVEVHCRVSQCLNCCDGGHTVRIEKEGLEVALVGVRTVQEMERVIAAAPVVAAGGEVAWVRGRTWQIWRDGRLVWHRSVQR